MSFEDYVKAQKEPVKKTIEDQSDEEDTRTLKEKIKDHKKREQQAAQEVQAHPPAAEQGKTLADIMANNEKSALFGKFIETTNNNTNNQALFERLVSKKLDPGDLEKLEDFRDSFVEIMDDAEKVEKFITPELITTLGEGDLDFQKLTNNIGSKRARDAFHSQLKEMAISDHDQFEAIQRNVSTIQSYEQGELKILKEQVEELCEKENISSKEYWEALSIKDEKGRNKAFIKLARKSWGTGIIGNIKRTGDWLSFGKILTEKKINRLTSKAEIDEIATQLAAHKKMLTATLAASVEKNEGLRNAFTRQIMNEPAAEPSKVAGMSEARKEVEAAATGFSEIEQRNEWAQKKKKISNWNRLSTDELDLLKDEFIKEFRQAREKKIKKGGFWSLIFRAIFDSLFKPIDKSKLY